MSTHDQLKDEFGRYLPEVRSRILEEVQRAGFWAAVEGSGVPFSTVQSWVRKEHPGEALSPPSSRRRCWPSSMISCHLVEELKAMATLRERKGFIVPCGRKAEGPRAREARARDMGRAWKQAGVREAAWTQRPHHAFRKGVRSGLKRLGADDMGVEFLLGHSLGIAGVYCDPDALPMRDAVNLIPPLTQMGEVVEFGTVES